MTQLLSNLKVQKIQKSMKFKCKLMFSVLLFLDEDFGAAKFVVMQIVTK